MSDVASQARPAAAVRWRRASTLALASGVAGIGCIAISILSLVLDVSPAQLWQPLEAFSSRIDAVLMLSTLVFPSLALALGGLLILTGEKRRYEVGNARLAFWMGAVGLCAIVVTFLVAMLSFSSGNWGGL